MSTTDDPLGKPPSQRAGGYGRTSKQKLFSPADRTKILPIGQRGQLAVNGAPPSTKEYWGDPGRTAEVMIPDDNGEVWMHTGDEAEMDAEGLCQDHRTDQGPHNQRGQNIHPLEVENRLLAHPAVQID